MDIKKLAEQLIKDANLGYEMSGVYACTHDLNDYPLTESEQQLLKNELAKFRYNLCKLEDAPAPFNLMQLKNRLLIYKEK